ADCDALDALATIVPPPPKIRAELDRALAELDEGEALKRAGHFADALAKAQALGARSLGYRAFDARLALLVGDVQQQLGDVKASEAALLETAQAAAEARDDITQARAWSML